MKRLVWFVSTRNASQGGHRPLCCCCSCCCDCKAAAISLDPGAGVASMDSVSPPSLSASHARSAGLYPAAPAPCDGNATIRPPPVRPAAALSGRAAAFAARTAAGVVGASPAARGTSAGDRGDGDAGVRGAPPAAAAVPTPCTPIGAAVCGSVMDAVRGEATADHTTAAPFVSRPAEPPMRLGMLTFSVRGEE